MMFISYRSQIPWTCYRPGNRPSVFVHFELKCRVRRRESVHISIGGALEHGFDVCQFHYKLCKFVVSLRRKRYFTCVSDCKIVPIFQRVSRFVWENVHVFGPFLHLSLRSFLAVRALIWWLRFTKRHCQALQYVLIIGWRLVKLLGIIILQDFQHASMVPVWASTLGLPRWFRCTVFVNWPFEWLTH